MKQLAILFVTFLFVSCAPVKDLELKSVDGFHLKTLEPKGLETELILRIENPNKFGFTIFPSNFDIYYSGVYLGKAQLLKKVKIKAREQHSYDFQLKNDLSKVNFFDLLNLLKPGAYKNEIQIKGELKAGKLLLRKKYKIDHKEKVSLN